MLAPGFVILSQRDGDALGPAGIATVSTTDAWEDGGFALGASAAAAGMLWCDRPYFTGNPTVEWFVEQANKAAAKGAYVQCGNEVNLPLEGWSGGPEAWFAFEDAVRARVAFPDALLAMPPSPGMPDWREWVRPEGAHAVHAYGDCAGMTAIVDWYLHNTTGDLYVTECNFGAGNAVDVDAWADEELRPFLDWCSLRPRVKLAAYFAWRWDQSSTLPTSVDAAGTAVERVIRDWTPPIGGGGPVPDIDWCPFAVRRPLDRNYTHGRNGRPLQLLVDHIADGMGSPWGWFNRVPKAPDTGSSAHFWVSRAGGLEQYVALGDTAWANGPICRPDLTNPTIERIVTTDAHAMNEHTVSVEHEGKPHQSWPDAQVATSARLHAWLYDQARIPADRAHTIGHYQVNDCNRANCPGSTFPWEEVIGVANEDVVEALRGQTWAQLEVLQAMADQWDAISWPNAASGLREGAEALKRLLAAGKDEH